MVCIGYLFLRSQNIDLKNIRGINGYLSEKAGVTVMQTETKMPGAYGSKPTTTKTPTETLTPTMTKTPTETFTNTPALDDNGRIIRPTDTRWPTLTPLPTNTRQPTFTPRPTETLQPTLTNIPVMSSADSMNYTDINGVNLDMKKYLDSYEEYVDEYIIFMQSYDSNDILLLVRYLSFLEKLDELSRNGEVWANSTSEMSYADYNYYMTVMNRINTKLIQAGQ